MEGFVRLSQLATTRKSKGLLPVSPATVWRQVKLGQFPKPIKLSSMVTAWDLRDVESWLTAQKEVAK